MYSDTYTNFKPRRGLRQSMPFIIVFGFITLCGIIPILVGMPGPGLALSGMGLVFLALILPGAAAAGKSYGIGGSSVRLKASAKEEVLQFAEIESVALLSKEESRRFMEELYLESVESQNRMDMGGWLRSNRRAGDVVRFLSVPVTGTEFRSGSQTRITSYSVKPDAQLILLRRKTGAKYLVSPYETVEFYRTLLQRGLRAVPAAAGEGKSVQSSNQQGKNYRSLFTAISIASSVLIFAAVGYFFILPAMKAPEDINHADESRAEDISGPAAVWLDDNSFAFGVYTESLPEMEQGGSVTAKMFSGYAAPLMLQLLESEGGLPAGVTENEELTAYLGDFLMMHSRMTFLETSDAGGGKDMNFYMIEQTDIKNSIGPLLRNRMKKAEL